MENSKTGFIYILTNESFHKSNWVKIGWAKDVKKRIKQLSNTSVPLPYDVYATYEVPFDSKNPDLALHALIQKLNPNLRVSSNREFFEIEPWDAYDILESMAIIHNRTDKLYRNKENVFFNDPEKILEKEDYSVDAIFNENSYVRELYEIISRLALSIYPDLTVVPTKNYVALKKGKKHNVIAIWPKENNIEVVLNAKQGLLNDYTSVTYDISNRLWPVAQYALRYDKSIDINIVKDLIEQTYKLVKI